jgi:hypothetical protein
MWVFGDPVVRGVTFKRYAPKGASYSTPLCSQDAYLLSRCPFICVSFHRARRNGGHSRGGAVWCFARRLPYRLAVVTASEGSLRSKANVRLV